MLKDFWKLATSKSSTSTVAIHTALTGTGKIFYMAGSGWDIDIRNGPYTARLLDPVTGTDTNVPLSKDLFCVRTESVT